MHHGLEDLLVLRHVPAGWILFHEEEGVDLAVRRKAKAGCGHELGIGADGKVPSLLEPRPLRDESSPSRLRHGIPSSSPGMKGAGASRRASRVGEESPLLSR